MIEITADNFIPEEEEESSFLSGASRGKASSGRAPETEPQALSSNALSATVEFFSHDSPLKRASEHGGRPYEYRKQQVDMALAVAASFEDGKNLCVEAPTGVGKSFAYLIPAIYHAMAVHRPVIVTTETITLQEQLIAEREYGFNLKADSVVLPVGMRQNNNDEGDAYLPQYTGIPRRRQDLRDPAFLCGHLR